MLLVSVTLVGCAGLRSFVDGLPSPASMWGPDHAPSASDVGDPPGEADGWLLGGVPLEKIGPQEWLDRPGQSVIGVVCGHVRRWERPGTNLVSIGPLQGDPFLLPDPNQLVSAQTWFWVLQLSDLDPLVAQSRYLKQENDGGGYVLTELWEIRDLGFSSKNEYWFDDSGVALRTRQSIHPLLPRVALDSSGGATCER